MKRKAVYLEWLDSASAPSWNYKDEMQKPQTIVSVGWVVSEDDQAITITTSESSTGHACHSPLSIPKVAIKKRRRVVAP